MNSLSNHHAEDTKYPLSGFRHEDSAEQADLDAELELLNRAVQ